MSENMSMNDGGSSSDNGISVKELIASTNGWFIIGKKNCVQCDVAEDEMIDRGMDYKKVMMEECNQIEIGEIKDRHCITSYPIIFKDGEIVGEIADFIKRL